MRKTPVVMLIVALIGGALAVGAPAAFASPELEGLGSDAPGAPHYQPAGPVARFAVPAASGVPVGSTASPVRNEHAELK